MTSDSRVQILLGPLGRLVKSGSTQRAFDPPNVGSNPTSPTEARWSNLAYLGGLIILRLAVQIRPSLCDLVAELGLGKELLTPIDVGSNPIEVVLGV